MIFPEITTITDQEQSAESPDYGKEWAFDFERNRFIMKNGTPVIVEGIDALKIFIIKTIKTARFKFMAHTWDYGCELEDIVGKTLPIEIIESETKRVITDALVYDARISTVTNFKVEKESDKLKISFRVETALNDELGVSIDV